MFAPDQRDHLAKPRPVQFDQPRAVLILSDIDGATAPEIGAALEMPVNRVYSRLRIARRDFRASIERLQGGEP